MMMDVCDDDPRLQLGLIWWLVDVRVVQQASVLDAEL
jgi:hypothetical protein